MWFGIQKEEPQQQISNTIDADHEPPQGDQTLGEITLEDFLTKAGVVQEAPVMGLGFQNAGNNLSAGNGFTTYHMYTHVKGYNVGESCIE